MMEEERVDRDKEFGLGEGVQKERREGKRQMSGRRTQIG